MEKAKWLVQGAVAGVVIVEFARLYYGKPKDGALSRTKIDMTPREQVVGSSVVITKEHHQRRLDYEPLITQVQSMPLQLASASSPSPVAPILPIVIIQPNPMLEIAFDRRTKNPCYVLEKISSKTALSEANTSARRTGKETFYEEKCLLPHHRSRNSYYRNSGFDRGHLAPVADFISFYKSGSDDDDDGRKIVKDTFNLCNTSPQYPTFNRHVWANVEQFVRTIIKEELSTDYSACIITGPVFLPSAVVSQSPSMLSLAKDENPVFQFTHLAIGTPPCIVSVPTHFFKVIAITSKDDNKVIKAAAFVLPNRDFSATDGIVALESYLVTLEDLEAVTGLEFFSKMFGKAMVSNTSEEDEDDNNDISNIATVSLRKKFLDVITRDLIQDRKHSKDSISNISATLVISKHQQRNIKKSFYKSKEDSIYHLCQHQRCSIDLRTGKRLGAV